MATLARATAYRTRVLTETAVVYTRTLATGLMTTVANAALDCRIGEIPEVAGQPFREANARRRLYYDPAYILPENAQLLISGTRYNPVPGTFTELDDVGGTVLDRRCEIVRAPGG